MRRNNKIAFFGAVVLCIALIASSLNISAVPQVNIENKVKIVKSYVTPECDLMETTGVLEHQERMEVMAGDIQVTIDENDQYAPAIGVDPANEYLMAFTHEEDFTENIVTWTFSTDGGATWDPGIYYDILGIESYPAISYRGSAKLFTGPIACDPLEANGAIQHTFMCSDPTDSETYELTFIEWGNSFPYFDRLIPDIAGYTYPEKDWWYGMIAVVGERDSPGAPNMPIFNYANYDAAGQGWSSYFATYSGCENAAIDFDTSNGNYFAAFDYLDGSDWDILLMTGNAADDGTGHPTWGDTSLIGDAENTTYPAIGANDDYVIILAQTNEAGNEDIVCFYSDDAGASFQVSYVADSGVDELYPTIVVYGLEATCTFIMDNDLYSSKTIDGGATWDTPVQVNDVDGTVESEFRYTDITTDGTVVWTDNQMGDLDIYLDNVGGPSNEPPGAPTITGPNGGKPGIQYTFTFNAVDPDGDNVKYLIDWGDATSDTTSFAASGTGVDASHTWADEGAYTITASAEDSNGVVGPQTTKTMNVPRGKALNFPFYSFLQSHPNMFPILRQLLGL
jgi:hypothetical protein